jgi:hypothetical protein
MQRHLPNHWEGPFVLSDLFQRVFWYQLSPAHGNLGETEFRPSASHSFICSCIFEPIRAQSGHSGRNALKARTKKKAGQSEQVIPGL